jgi:uncharacterized protein YecE (DUF72 family)
MAARPPKPDAGPAVLVGTSGFAYPHWNGVFYPEDLPAKERLALYARTFRTVELNVSFYRTPPATAFARWRDEVPLDFRFGVKASRYLTHVLRLRQPRQPVEYLMERAGELAPSWVRSSSSCRPT